MIKLFQMASTVSLIGLAACSSNITEEKIDSPLPTRITATANPSKVVILIPTDTNKYRRIFVSAISFPNNGSRPGQAVTFSLTTGNVSDERGETRLAPLNPTTANNFLDAFGQNTPPNLVLKMAKQVAAQTVCQNKNVTANTVGRSYSGTSLSKILNANNGKVLGAKVPTNIKGTAISVTEWRSWGQWEARLWCR